MTEKERWKGEGGVRRGGKGKKGVEREGHCSMSVPANKNL